jgi:hypothetical protein
MASMYRTVHRTVFIRRTALALTLTSASVLAACGKNLTTLTSEAMDGCLAARNADFKAGKGVTALATPLPPATSRLADQLNYDRAFKLFKGIAESAKDQATLVCALELTSHYRNGDVAVLLYKYTKHPDSAVSINARKLMDTQDPLPPGFAR